MEGFQFGHACDEVDQKGKSGVKLKNHTWSAMLKQVFKIDVSICTACGGDMRKVAAITNRMILTILKVELPLLVARRWPSGRAGFAQKAHLHGNH